MYFIGSTSSPPLSSGASIVLLVCVSTQVAGAVPPFFLREILCPLGHEMTFMVHSLQHSLAYHVAVQPLEDGSSDAFSLSVEHSL